MDESHFGINVVWTRSPGIGGSIKQKLDDFVVEERPLPFVEGNAGTAFLVEKRGLDTFETIQKIARALPTTYMFENMRSMIFSGNVQYDQIVLSYGLNAFYGVLAVWFFYRTFRVAKEKGLLVKYY